MFDLLFKFGVDPHSLTKLTGNRTFQNIIVARVVLLPNGSLDMTCSGNYSCEKSELRIEMISSGDISLLCDGSGACQSLVFDALSYDYDHLPSKLIGQNLVAKCFGTGNVCNKLDLVSVFSFSFSSSVARVV